MISTAFAQGAEGAAHASSILTDPTFWVGLSFLTFIALVAKPAWKMSTSALDGKIEEIRAKMEEATKLREEAQDMLAGYKRKMADAEKEAEAIIAQAREEAQLMKARLTEEMEAGLQRREKLAMDRIAQAEADATAEVKALTADIALSAAQQVISESMTDDRAETLVDTAIKELPEKFN